MGAQKLASSDLLIWTGLILGILDWLTDMIYVSKVQFGSNGLRSACLTFVIIQPVWYFFMYVVYVSSHEELPSQERRKKILLAVPYALLQQLKLIGRFETSNNIIYDKFK
jgi:hypothetical protein